MKDTIIQTGSRLALIIGLILLILISIVTIDYIYRTNILVDKNAKKTFKETSCLLITKKLSVQGTLFQSYRADFLVRYDADDVQYNHWVSGNGLDTSFNGSAQTQGDLLAQYDIGNNYPCYYDPANPERIILVDRHNWRSAFPILLPAVIMIISIYYLFKNIVNARKPLPIKKRKKKK